MDGNVKRPAGRGVSRHLRTTEEGGQKLAKSCGRLLWMALNEVFEIYQKPKSSVVWVGET